MRTSRLMIPFLVLVATAVALPVAGRAQEPVPDYSGGMLDGGEVLAAAVDVTTNRYPDADTVLVAGLERIRYAEDGTFVQWNEQYVKILTEDGRRSLRTLSSYFVIPYQRGPEDCRITLVEIVHTDGSTNRIDVATQSRVMIDPSSMSKNIYNPNEKIVQVNVGGLEVGDVLHAVYFDRIVQPRMTGTWNDWYTLESTQPIVRQTIEVEGPRALPLQSIALKDPVPGAVTATREDRGDTLFYRWEARNVPRVFPEPNMPELHTVVQRLLVSTSPDWPTVSRWYWRLSQPHYALTKDIEAKVTELTDGVESAADRIRALFNFVSQEIRYMGIIAESEAPGYEPHDVGDTFAARHGVCRDKAALLVAMLRAAGLEAFPTLIHNGPRKDPEVPQPFFNHAIVAVRHDDRYILMDPTDETTAELLPSYLDDRSYLVATPEGEILRTSPIEPAVNHLVWIETTGSVDAEGRLRAVTRIDFRGINDNAYRSYFARMQPLERDRLLEGVIKRAVPGARLSEVRLTPADMLDVTTNLSAQIRYEAEDVLVRGTNLAALVLPSLGTRVGMVNFIIGQTGLRQRRFPLKTEIACGTRERIQLQLDPSLNTPVSVPVNEPISNDVLYAEVKVRQTGQVLEANGEFRLDAVEFSPAEYLVLKKTLVELERALRKMPVYALPDADPDRLTSGADVLIEMERADYELFADGSLKETRTVRKRILTYAGKKRDAELSIRFNPVWDDVELVSGRVTALDGTVSEISAAELNVMDAAWVGSAPRYPAERILVASFPAVALGSVIEYTLVSTSRDRPFQSLRESFASFDAIREKHVTLRVPRGVTPRIYRHGFVPADLGESSFTDGEGGADVYAWTARDVPAVLREDQLPPEWDLQPTLFVSWGDWERYGAEVERALRRAASQDDEAGRRAQALIRDVTNAWERLRVIRDDVAVRVRPGGPDLPDVPLSAVSAADDTLRDAYGNGADRAALLYAMLRKAGFDPAFVLASYRAAIPRFRTSLDVAPERQVFADVLVRVRGGGLELPATHGIYLGDDDQYAALGSSRHAGMWCLELPEGRIAPLLPEKDDREWTEYDMTIDADGNARVKRRRLVYGTDFGAENRRYAEMSPEERRRYHQELISGLSQSAQPVGALGADFTGYPGRIDYTVDLPQYAIRDADYLYFPLPESLANTFSMRTERRVNPLFLVARGTEMTRFRVHLPAGFEPVIVPRALDLHGVCELAVTLSVSIDSTAEGGGDALVIDSTRVRMPGVVNLGDYAELLNWDHALSHPRARTLMLRKAPSLSPEP